MSDQGNPPPQWPYQQSVPPPKLEHSVFSMQTLMPVSFAIVLAGGIADIAYEKGKAESRDKQLEKIEHKMETLEQNIQNICNNTRGCKMIIR